MAVVRMTSDEYPNGGSSTRIIHKVSSDPNTSISKSSDTKVEFQPVVSEKGTVKKKVFSKGRIIGEYVLTHIVWPMVKDVIVNSVKDAISMAIYGEPDRGGYRRSTRTTGGAYIRDYYDYDSYGSYYKPSDSYRGRRSVDVYTSSSSFVPTRGNIEIEYPYYPEAVDVLRALRDGLDHHPSVTLSNLYELSRMNDMITPECNSRGWTYLGKDVAYTRQEGTGGVLILPAPCDLNGD